MNFWTILTFGCIVGPHWLFGMEVPEMPKLEIDGKSVFDLINDLGTEPLDDSDFWMPNFDVLDNQNDLDTQNVGSIVFDWSHDDDVIARLPKLEFPSEEVSELPNLELSRKEEISAELPELESPNEEVTSGLTKLDDFPSQSELSNFLKNDIIGKSSAVSPVLGRLSMDILPDIRQKTRKKRDTGGIFQSFEMATIPSPVGENCCSNGITNSKCCMKKFGTRFCCGGYIQVRVIKGSKPKVTYKPEVVHVKNLEREKRQLKICCGPHIKECCRERLSFSGRRPVLATPPFVMKIIKSRELRNPAETSRKKRDLDGSSSVQNVAETEKREKREEPKLDRCGRSSVIDAAEAKSSSVLKSGVRMPRSPFNFDIASGVSALKNIKMNSTVSDVLTVIPKPANKWFRRRRSSLNQNSEEQAAETEGKLWRGKRDCCGRSSVKESAEMASMLAEPHKRVKRDCCGRSAVGEPLISAPKTKRSLSFDIPRDTSSLRKVNSTVSDTISAVPKLPSQWFRRKRSLQKPEEMTLPKGDNHDCCGRSSVNEAAELSASRVKRESKPDCCGRSSVKEAAEMASMLAESRKRVKRDCCGRSAVKEPLISAPKTKRSLGFDIPRDTSSLRKVNSTVSDTISAVKPPNKWFRRKRSLLKPAEMTLPRDENHDCCGRSSVNEAAELSASRVKREPKPDCCGRSSMNEAAEMASIAESEGKRVKRDCCGRSAVKEPSISAPKTKRSLSFDIPRNSLKNLKVNSTVSDVLSAVKPPNKWFRRKRSPSCCGRSSLQKAKRAHISKRSAETEEKSSQNEEEPSKASSVSKLLRSIVRYLNSWVNANAELLKKV